MKKGRLILTVLLMTMAAALSGCTGGKTADTPDTRITIGIPQDLDDGLDPHKVSAGRWSSSLLHFFR